MKPLASSPRASPAPCLSAVRLVPTVPPPPHRLPSSTPSPPRPVAPSSRTLQTLFPLPTLKNVLPPTTPPGPLSTPPARVRPRVRLARIAKNTTLAIVRVRPSRLAAVAAALALSLLPLVLFLLRSAAASLAPPPPWRRPKAPPPPTQTRRNRRSSGLARACFARASRAPRTPPQAACWATCSASCSRR